MTDTFTDFRREIQIFLRLRVAKDNERLARLVVVDWWG